MQEEQKEEQVGRRRALSMAARADMWARWKAGESMSDIGRALGKPPASIFALLAVHGGIARPPRRRATRALTEADREQISRGLAAKQSLRAIARTLRRPASTISREVNRNGGRTHYRAVEAERGARGVATCTTPEALSPCARVETAGAGRGEAPARVVA